LPTRLIDVSATIEAPRLVLTKGRMGRYAALSHCWGGSLPQRTTKYNYEDYLKCIHWLDLPATFRDVANVTRARGLQYLWIDCFCIIQDSVQDWQHECASMVDVYRRADVTIAASSSRSQNDGLFRLNPTPVALELPVHWSMPGKAGTIVLTGPY
jgi:hypothetical protein